MVKNKAFSIKLSFIMVLFSAFSTINRRTFYGMYTTKYKKSTTDKY